MAHGTIPFMNTFNNLVWALGDTPWTVISEERPYRVGLSAMVAAECHMKHGFTIWHVTEPERSHLLYFPYDSLVWNVSEGTFNSKRTALKHKIMQAPAAPVMLRHRRPYMTIQKAMLLWLGLKELDDDTLKMVLMLAAV